MKWIFTFSFILVSFFGVISAQKTDNLGQQQWNPQNDEVYLQEVSVKIPTDKPVVSIAEAGGICFALVGEQLFRLENETLKPDSNAPSGISVLKSENNEIWAFATDGLYRYSSNKWNKIDDRKYVDMCMHTGKLHAATKDEIFRLEGAKIHEIVVGFDASDNRWVVAPQVGLDGMRAHLGRIDRHRPGR